MKSASNTIRFDPSEELMWYDKIKDSPYKLDFLLFYLTDHTLVTKCNFSKDYIDYVQNLIGRSVKYVSCNDDELIRFNNFWYYSNYDKNMFLKLSSKVLLAEFILNNHINEHYISTVKSHSDISNLKLADGVRYIVKKDHHFAGRGNYIGYKNEIINFLNLSFQICENFNFVVEEYLNRDIDFAVTLTDQGEEVIYQNFVNDKGQYIATKIDNTVAKNFENFLTKFHLNKSKIESFINTFNTIKTYYYSQLVEGEAILGSFDFFLYKDVINGELIFHPCCEFNPRWSMGRVAWELYKKFSAPNENLATFEFVGKHAINFRAERCIVLSPKESKIKYQMSFAK